MQTSAQNQPPVWRTEKGLWIGILTTVLFLIFGAEWMKNLSHPVVAGVLFVWLFGVILWLAFGVVRHADCLAALLGEPYGTLVLTLSVISIEVSMIASVMLVGENNPGLARDTMFSVLMIVLNGIVGLTLFAGGIKHREQVFNMAGAQAYLCVLAPLAVITLVVPAFTTTAPGGQVSTLLGTYLVLMSAGLYVLFLFLQTRGQSHFFVQPGDSATEHGHEGLVIRSKLFHGVFLVLTMLPVVLLAKSMGKMIEFGVQSLGAPTALAGFLVAILILSPEAMSAVKAARANQLQRTINIALGSSTSTIGMSVPVIVALSLILDLHIELGLEPLEMVLLALTLFMCLLSFGFKRTTLLQGAVHLLLFVSYIVLIFD